MRNFTPFNTTLDKLIADDLAVLKTVTEGWYVEYKQELPNAQSIAKSVSALANSYGGWVFYGIKEESKENSVAGEFLGISASEIDAGLQRIRQAVSNLMSPACHYEARAIYGPCEDIGLIEGRAIICITTPQSIEAPHIHNKGLIYRRIADGSEPVAETDRHMIEKMFQRSKETVESYKRWIGKDPELSKGESEHPYLRIMIVPNPWKMPRPSFTLNVTNAREILNTTEGRKANIPFDTVYSSATGIVARQCENRDPTTSVITWKIGYDLSSDIFVPFNWSKGSLEHIEEYISAYSLSKEFIAILRDSKISETTVVNLNYIFNILMAVIDAQRALQLKAGWPLDFHIKIKLLNVWRTIPFLDIDYFIRHIKSNGIPICLTNECISPPGNHPETFASIRDYPEAEKNDMKVTLQTLSAFIPIAEAFGIPLTHMMQTEHSRWSTEGTEGEVEYFFDKLTDAGVRSVKILNSLLNPN